MNAFDACIKAGENLVTDNPSIPMLQRLLRAAKRMSEAASPAAYALRERQEEAVGQFKNYLDDMVGDPDLGESPHFARIIQPPRTGKTVIAGHLIGATGLSSLFIVPSRQLVGQVAAELRKMLPETPVGMYYGEEKSVVERGVNVCTYQILIQRWEDGTLPDTLKSVALVFADEGHHAMTAKRMTFLRKAFDERCIRVALTATPDFNLDRTLSQFFPQLIHEITLPEAIELEMLAPLRVWVAEVDADGSVVTIAQGDYQEAVLGRLMSAAPFFKAVEAFRYLPENRRLGTIITCVSRQQAYDLVNYLEAHRPKGAPRPQLILSETPQDVRERTLEQFERGEPGDIDTLVVVGVLIEGWSSLHCKVLIDLAPTISRVLATQKFCRVLTRDGETEARIYQIVPQKLPQGVMMPMDILAPSLESYEAGELITSKHASQAIPSGSRLRHPRIHPITGVELKSRILMTHKVRRHQLKPSDIVGVRRVLASCPDFNEEKPQHAWTFRSLMFNNPLFVGRGDSLLRFCGCHATPPGYRKFLMKYAPDAAANLMYRRDSILQEFATCMDEYADLAQRLNDKAGYLLHSASSACRKTWWNEAPEDIWERMEEYDEAMLWCIGMPQLTPIEQKVIGWRFGFIPFEHPVSYPTKEENVSLRDIGKAYNLSHERIRQFQEHALAKLRKFGSAQLEDFNRRAEALAATSMRPAIEKGSPPDLLMKQIREYGTERYQRLIEDVLACPPSNAVSLPPRPAQPPVDAEEYPPGMSGEYYLRQQIEAYGEGRYDSLVFDVFHRGR
ncbi:MAG: DEAD/DEAH box helicase family protein [Patescibacteria group bacterium]